MPPSFQKVSGAAPDFGGTHMSRFGRDFTRGMGRFGATAPPGSTAPVQGAQVNAAGQGFANQGKANRFWFTYSTANIASLASGASTTNTILFDNDSSFEWTKLTATADGNLAGPGTPNASTIVVPLVTVLIQNTGAGTYYSNNPQPLMSYAGNWGLPYVMPAPQIIAPAATLQFTWANYSANTSAQTYYNVQLQLHGWKIYR